MDLVVQEGSFICFLSVNAGFEPAVDYDDFRANGWQSIVGCFFHRKVNGGWTSLRHASKSVASERSRTRAFFARTSFSSTEHMNAFAMSGPNGDPIATPSTCSYKFPLNCCLC